MKKSTKALLHLILGSIVSVISFIGFRKGIDSINDKMKKKKPAK